MDSVIRIQDHHANNCRPGFCLSLNIRPRRLTNEGICLSVYNMLVLIEVAWNLAQLKLTEDRENTRRHAEKGCFSFDGRSNSGAATYGTRKH
jgi:hypothetical protein